MTIEPRQAGDYLNDLRLDHSVAQSSSLFGSKRQTCRTGLHGLDPKVSRTYQVQPQKARVSLPGPGQTTGGCRGGVEVSRKDKKVA